MWKRLRIPQLSSCTTSSTFSYLLLAKKLSRLQSSILAQKRRRGSIQPYQTPVGWRSARSLKPALARASAPLPRQLSRLDANFFLLFPICNVPILTKKSLFSFSFAPSYLATRSKLPDKPSALGRSVSKFPKQMLTSCSLLLPIFFQFFLLLVAKHGNPSFASASARSKNQNRSLCRISPLQGSVNYSF